MDFSFRCSTSFSPYSILTDCPFVFFTGSLLTGTIPGGRSPQKVTKEHVQWIAGAQIKNVLTVAVSRLRSVPPPRLAQRLPVPDPDRRSDRQRSRCRPTTAPNPAAKTYAHAPLAECW